MANGEQTDAEWLKEIRAWAQRNAETITNARTVWRVLQTWDADASALRQARADLQEARGLLEEATGYARGIEGEDGAGLPTTESLLGRILIFLQRTEGRAE